MNKNGMIAENFDEFTTKALDQIITRLNDDEGKELTQMLLKMKLKDDPDLTVESWEHCKKEFVVFIFSQLMLSHKDLMSELAQHVYDEIRRDEL